MSNRLLSYFLSIILLTACSSQPQPPTLQATNTPTLTPSPTSTSTPTPIPTFTPTPTALPMAGPITENVMTRLGKGWVNDLTFSPNGKILSVATSIGVYLYQVETMELLSFLPSNAFVESIAFTDDETLAVGYNDSTTAIWNVEDTPTLVDTLQHDDPAILLATNDKNKTLVVERGFIDRPVNVIVWDGINPAITNRLMTAHLSSAAFSREKNLLALQTNQGRIMLVDAQKMKYTETICWEQCGTPSFSPNGEILASTKGWGDKAKIILWDTASQKELINIKEPESHTSNIAFSPDGKLLISASTSTSALNLWNVDTGELVDTFDGASNAIFSPDGLLIASVSENGDLILRDSKSGDEKFIVKGFTPIISQALFQNLYIASTSYQVVGTSYRDTIVLRAISTGEIIRTYDPADENFYIRSITFSSDGKTMIASSRDNISVLFDVITGERLQTLSGADPVIFSPDGSLLATSTTGNQLVIWDIASGEKLPLSLGLVPVRFNDPYKKSLVFSPDGSTLAILSDKVILRDVSTGKRIKVLESGLDSSLGFSGFSFDGAGALGEFSPNGTILASTWLIATSDDKFRNAPKGVIILWDALSGEKISILDGHSNPMGEYPKNPITVLSFSPDGALIASGAEDNSIIIWDAKNGNQLQVLQEHSGAITSLAFSPDGKLLYSGSLDGTVIIWDLNQLLPE